MAEPLKMKLFKETAQKVPSSTLRLEAEIPENLIQTMRTDKRFQNLTVSKGGDKDFIEIQEVVLWKALSKVGKKIIERNTWRRELLLLNKLKI